MLGTLACLALILGASMLVGAAVLRLCGWRARWLAPAVGLAALCPLAWWGTSVADDALGGLVVCALAAALAGLWLTLRRAGGDLADGRLGLAVGVLAALLAALPFIVEGRAGILGTGLNPDMSQHLFAADRLATGGSERLIDGGYPLGPHSLAVAMAELGPSTVQAFNGLTLAIAVAACLAPLALVGRLGRWWALAGSLCVGFAYLVAANLVQGAFKETMQALFVLAFAIGLGLVADGERTRGRRLPALVPLAVVAIGSVYVYSFPGLLWLGGAAGAWVLLELVLRREGVGAAVRAWAGAVGVALGLFVVAVAPELPRLVDFASFETFDPDGEGLGNLFNRLSPLEALGVWPTGDFRVEPGDGAVPAFAFYVGGAAAVAAAAYGLAWAWRRDWRAPLAALAAAAALWLYSLVAGTPYQEAKALVLAAPLVALLCVRALASSGPALAAAAYLAAAGGSSLLVLVNGQVGPSGYSPALAELRPQLGTGSTIVEAPAELLSEQHGRDYLVWELRGNRICVREEGSDEGPANARVIRVQIDAHGAVVPRSVEGPSGGSAHGETCPFIPDGARADPAADG